MDEWTMGDVMGALEHLIDDLDEIPRLAHARYRSYPPQHLVEHDRRAAAACVYSHMLADAERRFAGRRGIAPKDIRGLKVWIIEDKAVIRFKKMDEDGRSRNYPTKQAQDFDRGRALPGLPPPAARVSIGYLLDVTETAYLRTQAARPRGKIIEWCAAIIPASDAVAGAKRWIDVTRQSGWQ
ncbi:hypothetical protein STAQ_06980 [Allostella sp. ATCC 35155]|nr:hypothetical protein STAQ_06980 [Stella sp. ATCC 35155]